MKRIDKILLIDDDEIFSLIASELINDSQPNADDLVLCVNGARALRYISENDFKDQRVVVFLDINMPIVDGWDFLEKLENQNGLGEHYVYIVSSSINDSDKLRAMSYDVVRGYVSKPLTENRLREIFEEIDRAEV